MKKVLAGVYTETAYPGVLLGAVALEKGVIMIDAPPRPDDGRAWLTELRNLDGGSQRLLINLDSHPDRTLGARILESTVIAHRDTAKIFKQRPAIFKGQNAESGAEWETCGGLSGIRWLQPHIIFSEQALLHWGGTEVIVEHHPGPEKGACWVALPEKKVVFVGDAMVIKQPPFLMNADLPAWIDTLDVLLSADYKDFRMISSRGGQFNEKSVRNFRRTLIDLDKRLEKLGKRKTSADETDKLIPKLLTATESPVKYKKQYSQRLRYGLRHYFARNYYPVSTPNSSD
jgi:glyoxylase-like metal-dependent hydrolase (beta-lactamase superfamily II)